MKIFSTYLKIIFIPLLVLVLFSCRSKKTVTNTQIEKTEEKTETSKTAITEKKKDSATTILITPEIIEKTESTISKNKDGKIQDVNNYKKIGNLEVWYGIKNGKQYFDYKQPKNTTTSTNVNVLDHKNINESRNYVSKTDKSISSFTKIIRGSWNWKLWLLVIGLFLFIFRKQVLWLLNLAFPQAKFILWITKIFGSTESSRISRLEKIVFKNQNEINRQTEKLEDIKSMIIQLKPELFTS